MTGPRILFYDIETTGLKGDFGTMLAFGYKVHRVGKKATVVSLIDVQKHCRKCRRVDATTDRKLIEAVYPIVAEADMLVTWYGKGFDAKFLNTRVVDAGLKPLPDIPHVDLYWTARSNFTLTSNRLANWGEFLKCPVTKTPITKRVWRAAGAGDVEALEYVDDHCGRDVLITEWVYGPLSPYVRQHPRVAGWGACRVCGETRLTRHEVRMTVQKGRRIRLRCAACGHSETRQEAA